MVDDALLTEQLDYNRARAGEYDRWWNREGRFDRGAEANARWFAEAAELERVLSRFNPRGSAGVGLRNRAVDASLGDLCDVADRRRRLRRGAGHQPRAGDDSSVRYMQADLFDWTPSPADGYAVCVLAFWLSHVQEQRFAEFWGMVGSALRPGGRVLFIDSARTDRSTAADHRLPRADESTMTRRLDDGREFQIVKWFYEPRALESELASLGWSFQGAETGEFFLYGTGVKT